jgi:hypothetical protein
MPEGRKPKRKRSYVLTVRLDDGERASLQARASDSGLSVGAYVRASAAGDAGPRSRRRAPVERELLARANADLNRVGNNLNQISRALNVIAQREREANPAVAAQVAELASRFDQPLAAAMADLSTVLTAIRQAFGHDRQG